MTQIADKRKPVASTFRLGEEITAAMARLFERDGISPSEQARRALTAWLVTKGVMNEPKPRSVPSKKATKS